MRLAFLGTPSAAVPSLEALVYAGHEVALVVTRPDRKRGRGSELSPSPVKQAALGLGLPVSHSLKDLEGLGVERGIVVAYGALIPAAVLAVTPMLNVHFSLLPRWRGAAPVQRAILAGDEQTGVCVMTLEEALDTGPVRARAGGVTFEGGEVLVHTVDGSYALEQVQVEGSRAMSANAWWLGARLDPTTLTWS